MNGMLLLDVNAWLLGAGLAFSRMAPIFFMLPFLNPSVLNGMLRNAVIVIVGLGFLPTPFSVLATIDIWTYIATLGHELFIGVMLGFLLAWPFLIFQMVGSFIDNQRGATLSATVDPVNGIDTSEFSSLFNMFAAVAYLHGGGLVLLVEIVYDSYRLCDPLQACSFFSKPVLALLNDLAEHTVVIASPIVAVLLLAEFTLGLLSRFAPQLNAFSVSMTIKTVLALAILLIYFRPVFPDEITRLGEVALNFPLWFGTH
jgi:type III secretion system export apparatus protein